MKRSITTSALVGGVTLALAVAASVPASAQIVTGLPTGGNYSPYDTFAERWYDPGDWYGVRSRIGRQGEMDGTALGLARDPLQSGITGDPRGLGIELPPSGRALGPGFSGELGRAAPPARPALGGSPYFQQSFSPYYGWGYSDRSRDFYDPTHGGYPARDREPAGMDFGPSGEEFGPGTTEGVPQTDPEPNADIDPDLRRSTGELSVSGSQGTVPRSGRIDRDSAIFSRLGRYNFVEQGALPSPTYGLGPRYRGYYTADWYSDSAEFDDWYDTSPAPEAAGDLPPSQQAPEALDAPGGLDRPATPIEPGSPGSLREPGSLTPQP
ncbi:hypothetical protein [Tautonia marina]|uniref:hypothetical protein n=1 Tax=Tautonia marina TaxID=2653855 RepID=UPI0012604BBB|nr:hypothetical protein [Tautonia marina]